MEISSYLNLLYTLSQNRGNVITGWNMSLV